MKKLYCQIWMEIVRQLLYRVYFHVFKPKHNEQQRQIKEELNKDDRWFTALQ